MITSKDIEDVLEVLERDGWCKFLLENSSGSKCLLGGFNYVKRGRSWETVRSSNTEFASALGFPNIWGIVNWNNDLERTFDDVRDRLTEAAKELRNEGR